MAWKSGEELRAVRDELLAEHNLNDGHIIAEARVSMSTLYKFFRDDPTIKSVTRHKIEGAFTRIQKRFQKTG